MPNSLGVNPSTNWYHLSDFLMFVWSGVNIQREIPQMEPMTLHRLPRQARAQRRKMVERRGPGHISIWSEQFWTYLSFKARKKKQRLFSKINIVTKLYDWQWNHGLLKDCKSSLNKMFSTLKQQSLAHIATGYQVIEPVKREPPKQQWIETIWWAMYTPLSVCNTPVPLGFSTLHFNPGIQTRSQKALSSNCERPSAGGQKSCQDFFQRQLRCLLIFLCI